MSAPTSLSQTASSVLLKTDHDTISNHLVVSSDSDSKSKSNSSVQNINVDKVAKPKRDYKGFVAGVFSGIAKLSGKLLSPRQLFWSIG